MNTSFKKCSILPRLPLTVLLQMYGAVTIEDFFGTTAHWIDPEQLVRKSAALGCSRSKSKHIFDAIASTLEQVRVKYGISGKVVMTITDNCSNFIKAFRMFGAAPTDFEVGDIVPDPDPADDSSSANGPDTVDEEVDFIDKQAVIGQSHRSEDLEYCLPPHRSCASHTLNLVATTDAAKANTDAAYKKLYYSTMGKCSALWNKVSRSLQASETVHDELGIVLILPSDTRRNSQFDAVDKIRTVATSADAKLRPVCEKLAVSPFRPNEVIFLNELCSTMKPVATALDMLPAQKNCYIGYLLPT
jgi:hypothetical protein